MKQEDNVRLRALGTIEKLMVAQQALAGGTTQGCKVLSLAGSVEYGSLVAAAHTIYCRYQILRCSIERTGDEYYFRENVRFEDIPVSEMFVEDQAEWLHYASEEVHKQLDDSRALWRVLLLTDRNRRHAIVLTCHHAILDEEGGGILARALLKICDRQEAPPTGKDNPVPLPRPVDDFLLPPQLDAAQSAPARYPIVHRVAAPLAARRTKFLFQPLPPELMASIGDCAVQKRLSVNSILCASLSIAAYRIGVVSDAFSFKSALSLREFSYEQGAVPGQLGCYIGVADTVLNPRGKDTFTLAAEYQRSLICEALPTSIVRKQISAGDAENAISAQLRSTAFGGFGLTNLGSLDMNDRFSSFALVNNYSLTNRLLGNLAFAVQLYQFGGRTVICYQYVEPLMDMGEIGDLHEALIACLSQTCLPGTDMTITSAQAQTQCGEAL